MGKQDVYNTLELRSKWEEREFGTNYTGNHNPTYLRGCSVSTIGTEYDDKSTISASRSERLDPCTKIWADGLRSYLYTNPNESKNNSSKKRSSTQTTKPK